MRKLCLFILALLASVPSHAFIIDGRDALKSEYSAVIDFEVFIEGRLTNMCTATFIAKKILLTAAHCLYPYSVAVSMGREADIVLPTDKPFQVLIPESYRRYKLQEEQGYAGTELMRISSDLALIVFEEVVNTSTLPYSVAPAIGAATMVGFGGKQRMTRTELDQGNDPTLGIKRVGTVEIERVHAAGRLDTVSEVYEAEHWYNWGDFFSSQSEHHSLSSRGDSGGPVIQNGKVVAVISGTDSSHQDEKTVFSSRNYFAGLNSSEFQELLARAKKLLK